MQARRVTRVPAKGNLAGHNEVRKAWFKGRTVAPAAEEKEDQAAEALADRLEQHTVQAELLELRIHALKNSINANLSRLQSWESVPPDMMGMEPPPDERAKLDG